MDFLSWVQWPAMAVSVVAAWLVGSHAKSRRQAGFWWFLASNGLWIAWGIPERAWALITLQVALAAMNVRGTMKNERKG